MPDAGGEEHEARLWVLKDEFGTVIDEPGSGCPADGFTEDALLLDIGTDYYDVQPTEPLPSPAAPGGHGRQERPVAATEIDLPDDVVRKRDHSKAWHMERKRCLDTLRSDEDSKRTVQLLAAYKAPPQARVAPPPAAVDFCVGASLSSSPLLSYCSTAPVRLPASFSCPSRGAATLPVNAYVRGHQSGLTLAQLCAAASPTTVCKHLRAGLLRGETIALERLSREAPRPLEGRRFAFPDANQWRLLASAERATGVDASVEGTRLKPLVEQILGGDAQRCDSAALGGWYEAARWYATLRCCGFSGEGEPRARRAVARAVVAHLTAESRLLKTDPVYKWASTRWPTFVQICMSVIDYLVPEFGSAVDVMPLGGDATLLLHEGKNSGDLVLS
mgnify:CR=1 FL=1